MGYSLTAIALVVGVGIFMTKYAVAFTQLSRREHYVLLGRIALNIAAIIVVVAPLDYCSAWAFDVTESLISAFVIAVCEVYGLACRNRASIATSAITLVYAIVHADHSRQCGAGFFAASVGGLVVAPVLWRLS